MKWEGEYCFGRKASLSHCGFTQKEKEERFPVRVYFTSPDLDRYTFIWHELCFLTERPLQICKYCKDNK
jgi:hypothetical protein